LYSGSVVADTVPVSMITRMHKIIAIFFMDLLSSVR